MQYNRHFTTYLSELRNGNNLGRPRRPNWNSLNLDTPTEFERFLHPLKSFFFQRLRMAFSRLVRDAEDGQFTVLTNVNALAVPDGVAGQRRDMAAGARWNAGNGGLVAVRIDNFNNFVAPAAPQFPAPGAPLPVPAPPVLPVIPAPPPPVPQPVPPQQVDANMLELCRMGRSTIWKGVFIYMTPWQVPIRVSNPFVSRQYKQAFIVAQEGFFTRFMDFKRFMDAKRTAHAAQWRLYKAYTNELRDISMLDNNRFPVNPYAERPQIEHFTQEWKHFAFGLKEEMKNFRFLPLDALIAVVPVPANLDFVGGPILQPYADISQSVLNSALKMFLI